MLSYAWKEKKIGKSNFLVVDPPQQQQQLGKKDCSTRDSGGEKKTAIMIVIMTANGKERKRGDACLVMFRTNDPKKQEEAKNDILETFFSLTEERP